MIHKILVLDTETGGLKPPEAGVVELAYIDIDEQLNILESVRSLINPEKPISPISSGVHGLTMDDVKDSPTLSQFLNGRFQDLNVVMIGHNIVFDIRFVGSHFAEVDGMCTLKLARLIYPDAPDHKLQTLMYHLNLPKADKHNALDDVMTCYHLLKHMMVTTGLDLQGLYNMSKQKVLVENMPFGKHKGKPLKSLDKGYVKWLLEKTDNLDENLRYSLERLL